MLSPTVLLVGDPGCGKTVTVWRALNPAATEWITTDRDALVPVIDETLNPWRDGRGKMILPTPGEGPGHYIEALDPIRPYEELHAIVLRVIGRVRDGKTQAVVLDTLTTFVRRESTRIALIEQVKDNYGRANDVLMRRVSMLISMLLASGAIVICTAHEREPSMIESKLTKGGATLPGKLLKEIPGLFSMVIRQKIGYIGTEKTRIFQRDEMTVDWITKDRYNVVQDGERANLGDVLKRAIGKARSAGVSV